MTGEELYGVHRRSLNHQGIMTKAAMKEAQPARHWYELDERLRQAWEATAEEITRQHQVTDGMLRPVGSEAYGGGPAGF